MWDLPGPGVEPVSPALAGKFLTTAPPGKSPSSEFLISVIYIFSSNFFRFLIFLLLCLFYLHIIFFTFFTSSFSSLSIYKTVVLKSLSSLCDIRSFRGTVPDVLFFSFEWAILSYFFVCFVIFVQKWTTESNNMVTLEVRVSPFPKVFCFLLLFFGFLIVVGCLCAEDHPEG